MLAPDVSFGSEVGEPSFGNNVTPVLFPALVKPDELTIPKVYRSVPGIQGDTNMDPPMPYGGAINNIIRIHFPEKSTNKLVCNKENQLTNEFNCSQNDNCSLSKTDGPETTKHRIQRNSCSEMEQSFSSNISDDEPRLIIDLAEYKSDDDDTNYFPLIKPDQVVKSSSDKVSGDTERHHVKSSQDSWNSIDAPQIQARTEVVNKSRYPKPVQVSAKTLPRSKKMLLWGQKMIAKMPHIINQGNAFAVWTDIKEILFPLCSHAICNIVLNALKLKLDYPRLSLHMHPCTQIEHVSFARCLRVVYPGTMLVNLKKVHNILPELWHIVARNHLSCKHNEVSVHCQYVVNAKTMYWNMIASQKNHFIVSAPHANLNGNNLENHENLPVRKMTSYVPHSGKLYRVASNLDKLPPKKEIIMTNKSGLGLSYLPKDIREHLIQEAFICDFEDESHAREMAQVKMPSVLIRDPKHIETSEFIQLFSSVQQNLISNKYSDLEFQAQGNNKLKFLNKKKHIRFQAVEGFRPDPCMISNEENVQLSFPILRISGTNNDAFIPMPELARFFPQMHGYLFQMCIKYIIGRRPSDICEHVPDGNIKCCSAGDGQAFTKWLLTARHVGGEWSHITSTCLLMKWSRFVKALQTISAGQQQVRDCGCQQTNSESLDASQKQSKHQSDLFQLKHRPMNNVVRSKLLPGVNEARGNRSTLNPVLTENKYVYPPRIKLVRLRNSTESTDNVTCSSASNIPNDSARNNRAGTHEEKANDDFTKSHVLSVTPDISSRASRKEYVPSSNAKNVSSERLSLHHSFPENECDTLISIRDKPSKPGVYVIGQINIEKIKQRVGMKNPTKEQSDNEATIGDSPNMQNPEGCKKVAKSLLIEGDINEHRMKLRSNVALIDTDHRYGNVDRIENNATSEEVPKSVNGKETTKKMRKRRKLNRKGSRRNSFDNKYVSNETTNDKVPFLIGIPDVSTKPSSSNQVDSSTNPPHQLINTAVVENHESYSGNSIIGVNKTRKKSKTLRKNRQLPNLYDDEDIFGKSDAVLNVQHERAEERNDELGVKDGQDEENKKEVSTASSDDHSEESSSLGSDECSNNGGDSEQPSSVYQELLSSEEETDVCTPLPSSEIAAIYNALCRNSQKISSVQKEEKRSKKKQKKRRETRSLIVSKQQIDDAKVYPCYGKFVKALPIKKNLLIREMLVNDVEKLKELACLVCTCVNAVTKTDGEQMKKYFQKKHKKNSNHCLVHSNKLDTLSMVEKTKEHWSPTVVVRSAPKKFCGKYLKFHNLSPLKTSKKLSCHKKVSPPKKHFLNKYRRQMLLGDSYGEKDIQNETESEKYIEQKVVYAHPKKYFLKRFDQEDDTSVDGDSHFEHYKPPYDYNVLIKRYIRIGRLAPSVDGDAVVQDQQNSINLSSKAKIAVSNLNEDKGKSANSTRVTSKKSVSKRRQKNTISKTQEESKEDRQLQNLIKSQLEILKVIQNRAAKQKECGVLVKRNEKINVCTKQREPRSKTKAVGRKRRKRSTRDFVHDFNGRIC